MNNGKLPERDTDGKLPAYAWPGGYPIIYLDGQNSTLCADCATESADDPDAYDFERPVSGDVYWEGPDMYCDECNKVLESAYGDPDAPDDDDQDDDDTGGSDPEYEDYTDYGRINPQGLRADPDEMRRDQDALRRNERA